MTPHFLAVHHDIDERLHHYLEKVVPSITSHTSVAYVKASAAYLEKLALGGKRVRGYCVVGMYETVGGKNYDAILNTAVAMELFHLFALIQDDVMDKATTRRGIATMHNFTENWLREQKRQGDLAHVSQSQAILWGDFLLALSQSKLQASGFTGKKLTQALGIFSRMFTEVVVGQMIDVDMVTHALVSEVELQEKNLLKSALYTFVRPMQIGASLAGGSLSLMQDIEVFGTALGIAFQIQDDLFDLTLSEDAMHKPVLNDVRAGSHTLFSHYVLKHATEAQKNILKRAFGATMTMGEETHVRQVFHDSGAIQHGTEVMTSYFQQAEKAVKAFPSSKQQQWHDLIDLVRNRVS